MNRGARSAQGKILLFLHADSRLPANALRKIERAYRDPSVQAGCFKIKFQPETLLLRIYAWFSGINSRFLTYGDQAYFVKREFFFTMHGFKDYPICEDIEFQRRLRRKGTWVKISDPVVTSSRKFLKKGILWQQLINLGIVLLFFMKFSPEKLYQWYYGVSHHDAE